MFLTDYAHDIRTAQSADEQRFKPLQQINGIAVHLIKFGIIYNSAVSSQGGQCEMEMKSTVVK